MFFSFVLPAWKGLFLYDAIASILAQTYKDFELVVVDDCSRDNIKAIVESFNDQRITYHRNDHNIGGHDLVAQWNHCLQYAKSDYVILATDDDLYETSFLETMVGLIAKYPDVDLFRSRILQVDADNKIKAVDACYKEFLTHDEFVYHLLHGMKGGIPQYVFKTSVLRQKGGFVNFPLAWSSDDATAIMMSDHGIVTTQEHLVRFRWSDANISSDKKAMPEKIQARLMFYHWLCNNLRPINPVDERTAFLHDNIDNYLSVYNKVTLIDNIKRIPLYSKMECLMKLIRNKDMERQDKISVMARSLSGNAYI